MNTDPPRNVVVVGAGIAGISAVDALRDRGYQGNIAVVSAEAEEPYNLPPLSKELLTGAVDEGDIRLRTFAELTDLDVELVLDAPALALDTANRVLHTARGKLPYDKMIIATGLTPIWPDSWRGLDGVTCLRTLDDARTIRAAMKDRAPRVVIIGAGFIGCEIASSAREYGLETTIVEQGDYPLSRALSRDLADPIANLHNEHGVQLLCGRAVNGLLGAGHVEAVELADGTRIVADLVVVGIGGRPVVDWLRDTEVDVDDGVLTDATLQTAVPGIYAAGDIARWSDQSGGPSRRVEHWTCAREQGAQAAANLLDPAAAQPFSSTPYVWSDQYGQRLQVVGDMRSPGELRFLRGEPGADSYLAALVSDGRVVAGVGFGEGKPFLKLRKAVVRRAAWDDVAADLCSTPTGHVRSA